MSQGRKDEANNNASSLASKGTRVLILAAVLSLAFHFSSLVSLRFLYPRIEAFRNAPQQPTTVRIKFPENIVENDPKKILESKQEKTEPPKDAKYAGEVAHKTERETRIERDETHRVDAEAGRRGSTDDPTKAKDKAIAKLKAPETATKAEPPLKVTPKPVTDPTKAKMSIGPAATQENRAEIAALLPSASELMGRMNAGYQEFIDDTVDLGEAVDINTAEYRYVGYFTNMRKSIELVWNYPYEAAVRGMEGKVILAFNIESDGTASRIKVIESSGFKILDDAIVRAIQLAAPFAPLPSNMKLEKLTVKGAFYYRLSNMLGAH